MTNTTKPYSEYYKKAQKAEQALEKFCEAYFNLLQTEQPFMVSTMGIEEIDEYLRTYIEGFLKAKKGDGK